MCGGPGGPGGVGDAVTEGAALVGGSGLGTAGFGSNFGVTTGGYGQGGLAGTQSALPPGTISNSDTAKGVALIASGIPFAGSLISAMDYAGAFEGEPTGDVSAAAAAGTGPGGLGGPGADPSRIPSGYLGPSAPPVTSGTATPTPGGPNIIPPTIVRSDLAYSAERGKTPAEIDAANKLRMTREQAYAQQKTNAESELLKALSLRDVTSGTPEARLTENTPASAKFTGLPPALGQSRHRWA